MTRFAGCLMGTERSKRLAVRKGVESCVTGIAKGSANGVGRVGDVGGGLYRRKGKTFGSKGVGFSATCRASELPRTGRRRIVRGKRLLDGSIQRVMGRRGRGGRTRGGPNSSCRPTRPRDVADLYCSYLCCDRYGMGAKAYRGYSGCAGGTRTRGARRRECRRRRATVSQSAGTGLQRRSSSGGVRALPDRTATTRPGARVVQLTTVCFSSITDNGGDFRLQGGSQKCGRNSMLRLVRFGSKHGAKERVGTSVVCVLRSCDNLRRN